MNIMPNEYIKNLKKENNLKIVDVHVHPFDVIGVVHYSDFDSKLKMRYEPGMFDNIKFSRTAGLLVMRSKNNMCPSTIFPNYKNV